MAQPITCQNCNSAPATLQCTTCPASLCQACKDNTHSAPLFKSHVVTLLTAAASAAPAEEKKEKKEKAPKEKKEKAPKEKKEKKKEKKGFYSKVVDGLHYVGNIGAAHPHEEQKSPSSSDASKAAEEKKEEKKKEEVSSPRKSVKGLFGLGGKKEDKKKDEPAEPAHAAAASAPAASNGGAVSPRTAQANANAAQEAKLRELALKEAEDRARREEADRVVREAEEKAAAERAEKARIAELDAQARQREKEREVEQAREAEAKAKERAAYDAVLTKAESEARQFLEGVLGEKLPAGELSEALRSGVVLCRALNALRPNSVARVDTSGQAFKQRENIGYYLEACRAAGIKDEFLFVTADLFDARNIPQVLRHVIALKRHFADSAAAIASGSSPSSPATATAAGAAPVSPRGRVTKPLPPPPGQSPGTQQLNSSASTEERPPSWLNNVPPPPPPKPQMHAVEEESTTLSFSAKAPTAAAAAPAAPAVSAPALAPVAVAPAPSYSPTSSQSDLHAPAPIAKSVQVQEPTVASRPARPYGASENGDDVDREAERLQRTMARKSGKGITFAPATKVEPVAAPAAAAPAANTAGSVPSVEPTAEQAGDFNWWNTKTFAELRKECERRNIKATAGGKEGFIKALMAHYGHSAPAAPAPVVSTPAPAPVTPEKVSVSATVHHGGGSGSTVAEHNVAVPHADVDEDMREQARLDRAVARKSGKFRAGF